MSLSARDYTKELFRNKISQNNSWKSKILKEAIQKF
jgi:hypothetical protein